MPLAYRASLIALVIAIAAPAHAGPWSLILDGECADPDAFRARTETQRVRGGEVAGVGIRVALSAQAASWHVRVEITGADRQAIAIRELDGESCAAVNDAAILIVAQLLDGVARPVVAIARPRTLSAPPDEPPVRERPLAEPVSVRVTAGLGTDLGTLPTASPGARAAVELGWWRAVLALGAARWLEVTELDDGGEGLSAYAWQAFAGLRFRIARRVELGAQFEIGELVARGRGVATALTSAGAWQAVGATARVPLAQWGRLDVAVELDLLAPLGGPTFLVDGEPRYQPRVSLRGFIGVGWRLFDGNRGVWP